MHAKSIALLLGTSLLVFSGCGADTHEKIANDMISEMKNLVAVLENLKSPEDVEAAKPKIKKIAERLKAIKKRADKIGDPSEEVQKKLEEKFKKEMAEMGPKLMAAMLTMPEDVRKEVDDAMNAIQ